MAKECSKSARETCTLTSETWVGLVDELSKELLNRKPSPDTTASLTVTFYPIKEDSYNAQIDQQFHPQPL